MSLTPKLGTVNAVFEGVRGGGVRGDIALDDVNVLQGSCAGTPGIQDLFVLHFQLRKPVSF